MEWLDRFRRGKDDGDGQAGGAAGSPEGHGGPLPTLTEEDRSVILQMVQQEFAQHGREVVPDGRGGLHGIDGRAYGTGNIEASLRLTPREHWHEVVANHVRIMDSTIDSPGARSLAEVRDRVYLRLREQSRLPSPPDYGSPVLPGIVGMVAIDHPEHTEELGGIDSFGSWEEIEPLAIENIRRLPPMQHAPVPVDANRPDTTIHVFDTTDFFGPSRIYALDQLTARIGSPEPALGLLVIVPNRHVIALHEIRGEGGMLAMNGMVNLALAQYNERPGALSPHVFYVGADGRREQVTEHTEDRITVQIRGAIAETFAAVGLGGE